MIVRFDTEDLPSMTDEQVIAAFENDYDHDTAVDLCDIVRGRVKLDEPLT